MQKHTLIAEKRVLTGRKVKTLRAKGMVPATVYGRNVKSESVSVQVADFHKLYAKAGNTGLIDLTVGKSTIPVLVNHIQTHPVTDNLIHIEFHQVNLKEKVHAKIPLVQSGESPAVEQKLGELLITADEIEVEALPTDLPEKIIVDTSVLTEVGSEIRVSDLKIPKNVEVLTEPTLTIAKIESLVTHEVEEPKPEVSEEAEAAEGEAAKEKTEEEETPPQDKSKDVKPETGDKKKE